MPNLWIQRADCKRLKTGQILVSMGGLGTNPLWILRDSCTLLGSLWRIKEVRVAGCLARLTLETGQE